uniref:Uncharacterized protein n=1 Tax=Aegilops tauschii subsp. strangulata TaxID=200361 RepID=A0A453L410_AEGTS
VVPGFVDLKKNHLSFPYSYKKPSCCSCKYRRAYHRHLHQTEKALATSYDKKNRSAPKFKHILLY